MSAERDPKPEFADKAAFDIVALAASAGGLTALTRVLSGLPEDFPAPVVVVQHLDPRHRSLMAEILSRRTPLAVKQAETGDRLRPGTVYIAPPDHHLLANGDDVRLALHLHNPYLYRDDHGQRWIDAAQRDTRLSLLLDVQQPDSYKSREGSQIVFRCSDSLASRLIEDWHLPASVSDLTELPADTAVARLPGMVVTLKVKNP